VELFIIYWHNYYGKQYGGLSKINSICDLTILSLGIYPKEMKMLTQKDICTPIFVAACIYNSQDMETG